MQPSPPVSIDSQSRGKKACRGCKIPISEPVPGSQSHAAFPCEGEKPPGSAELQGNAAEPPAGTGIGAAAGPAATPPSKCHMRGCATAHSRAGCPADASSRCNPCGIPPNGTWGYPQPGEEGLCCGRRDTNAFPAAEMHLPRAVGALSSHLPFLCL